MPKNRKEQPMICKECGATIEQRTYIEETQNEMDNRQLCFDDNYWFNLLRSDQRTNSGIVTKSRDGYGRRHFQMGPSDGTGFQGFGGLPFTVIFIDNGRVFHTNNLESQGYIPEHWYDRFPVNAIIKEGHTND